MAHKQKYFDELANEALTRLCSLLRREKVQPRVLNRYKLKPWERGVDIGRGTPWGNPYPITPTMSRDQVCDKFDKWVYSDEQAPLRAYAKEKLKGKNLICFCQPLRCHGTTWLKIANEE